MKLRLRTPPNSKKFNSFQQVPRISNGTSILKIGHFAKRWETDLGLVPCAPTTRSVRLVDQEISPAQAQLGTRAGER
jgi:hypothetical protein